MHRLSQAERVMLRLRYRQARKARRLRFQNKLCEDKSRTLMYPQLLCQLGWDHSLPITVMLLGDVA